MGRSSTRSVSPASLATSGTTRLAKGDLSSSPSSGRSKVTMHLLSPASIIENFAPPVIMSIVAFRSAMKRGWPLPAPPQRGSSRTHATVLPGSRPSCVNSSSSCSILFLSFFGAFCCFCFLENFAGAAACSSGRTLVLPFMNCGAKAMTSSPFSFHGSPQKRSSIFGSPSSASSAVAKYIVPFSSASIASICFSTAEPAGMNFLMRVDVSSTAFARLTMRFGTMAKRPPMLWAQRIKAARGGSRPRRRPAWPTAAFRNSHRKCTKRLRSMMGSDWCPWSK
mmetsp:Transcript_23288/g.69339  ORF Transcript_23288/g.69339 Transcript_23288/m.69339 type:complete len:280 (+) Transcript_23288:142-981(+)